MIAYLSGTVVLNRPGHPIICVGEVGGPEIGYEVVAPLGEVYAKPREAVSLLIYHAISERGQTLLGFRDSGERCLALELMGVPGIGPVGAHKIATANDAKAIRAAIASGDLKALRGAQGIGKSTADKIVATLQKSFKGDLVMSLDLRIPQVESALAVLNLRVDRDAILNAIAVAPDIRAEDLVKYFTAKALRA